MRHLTTIAFGLFLVLAFSPPVAAGTLGKHTGDAAPLEYEIVYTNFPGIMTIDESGATYYFPDWDRTIYTGGSYDEKYFGTYAVYFIGDPMSFEIHLRNRSNRTYRNLKVVAAQEYHLTEGAEYGTPLPGGSTLEWFIRELRGGEEIVLNGMGYVSSDTLPGLDQTHVQVLHWVNGNQVPLDAQLNGARAQGRIFVDDPEAGVYCPPVFTII